MLIEKPFQFTVDRIEPLEEKEGKKQSALICKFQNKDSFGDPVGKPETYRIMAWENTAVKLHDLKLKQGDEVMVICKMNGFEGHDIQNGNKVYYNNSLSIWQIKKVS